jgi:hypothetical protein
MPVKLRKAHKNEGRPGTGDWSSVPGGPRSEGRLSGQVERNEVDEPFLTACLFLTFIFVLMLPAAAMAYVGPGAGITLLGALWAVIVAVVLMVGGLLAWPFRAFLRRRKNARPKEAP